MIPGMTILSTIALGITKSIIKRIAKPEKIVNILVKWLVEYAEKDDTIDWKDKLADLMKK